MKLVSSFGVLVLLWACSFYFVQAQKVGKVPDLIPEGLRIATFDIDATPPVGSYLAYDQAIKKGDLGLRAKGVVLTGAGRPIVLCSVDWIGIANEGHDAFRQALADAVNTTPDRVAVHTVHQHDAPICDFSSERMLREAGFDVLSYNGDFAREVLVRLKNAANTSLNNTQKVTHIGLGEAPVYKVASNRRIVGEDGKIHATRYTTCKDSALRAEPEGLIDPMVSLVSFWNEKNPVAVLSYYAVHPQSYYRTGVANPDFPGIARFYRQLAVPDALHVHFSGAGGDLGAGKYNDGAHENRMILAERLADGMKRAWESTKLEAVTARSVKWNVKPVSLPYSEKLEEQRDWMNSGDLQFKTNNIFKIAWLQRLKAGKKLDITCLCLGSARIVHLPGEPFVQYQLSAKAERPDLFVAVAGYGDYGPGYIPTAESFKHGGYETGLASGVSSEAEKKLMNVIRKLLNKN
uniref:hypothetical protein n=1 Tax=uncultured Draconibacterium sp. TaxID=1573823 RepID=UPI003217E7C2